MVQATEAHWQRTPIVVGYKEAQLADFREGQWNLVVVAIAIEPDEEH
jgi:hypothetical protein